MLRFTTLALLVLIPTALFAQGEEQDGFRRLFNGTDLTGWTPPKGDNGHWKVIDGVIDYDAASESPERDKNLWSEEEFGDFILKIDWRIKETPSLYHVPIVKKDGTYVNGTDGKPLTILMPNADSGVFLRGSSRAQINIWCWPIGSGEVYGYRHKDDNAPEVRAGVTPMVNADNPVGEWNQFTIIMVGDRLTVIENNQVIIEDAPLPDVPAKGKFFLQHHGGRNPDGTYKPASSLVQFRNIWIKELP